MILTSSPTRWEQMLVRPLSHRLDEAPEELVKFVAQFNAATGNPAVPQAFLPDVDFLRDVQAALEELPQAIKDQLEPRLLGVFFVTGLGSSAITDLIAYNNGDPLGAVIALDAEVFANRTANEWITWRENTAFNPGHQIHLSVRIASEEDDTRKSALQYLLLHELGHVMACISKVMPNWWEQDQSGNYSFPPLSWEPATGKPKEGQDFPQRSQIALYSIPQLQANQIPSTYQGLSNTSFPTLYAATNLHEDFAESYATYIHTVLLNKPFEVQIYHAGQLMATYGCFWHKPASKEKAEFFENFIAEPPAVFPRREQHAEAAQLGNNIIERATSEYLGLAPFLRLSVGSGDLRHVAQELLKRATEDQDNSILWMNLATAFFSITEREVGLAIQEQALFIRQQFHLPAALQPTKCRVLMIAAAGDLAENTPLDCLLETSHVEITLFFATPAAALPVEIPPHDVLLVGLSDTEKNRPILKTLEFLLAEWDRPVINLPQCIPNVERKTASELLQDVQGLDMPLTHQVSRESLVQVAQGSITLNELKNDCHFPIILRSLGSHAGRDLEKIDGPEAILPYLDKVPGEEYYLSRFVDYSGGDGQFRKFRIALVAGEPFAVHMAISSHWMIHYVNAGMYQDQLKCQEEAAFMAGFDEFAKRHEVALNAVARRFGLDYICIDCAETRDGQLLIFEVDHAMVVHAMDPVDLFPYKQGPMLKVRDAFQNLLLNQMANPVRPLTPCSAHENHITHRS